MTASETELTLVNINQLHFREVVIQMGAYAEHQCEQVEVNGQSVPVDSSTFQVRLSPGCGTKLTIRTKRYANPPTLWHPWDRIYAQDVN